MNSEVIN